MKKVTIRRIGVGSLVKWHVTYSLIAGIVVGLIYAVAGYAYTRENLSGYLFWYALGMPLMYLILGVVVSLTISVLFNAWSDASGGLVLEIEVEEDGGPPPPPIFSEESS